jgi:glycosyltransferase involved in cell wall biosynthesis
MKEISVVIPVYNSHDNLAELSRQLHDALRNLSFEVIFVDDHSTDNSWKVIKQLATENKDMIVIRLRKNFGQDNALMAGFRNASGNYIVIMDDDLQHSPYDILKLYNKCKEGHDVCYARFSQINQKAWKNFGSCINGCFARLLLQKPRGIYLSPFKVVRKEIIKEISGFNGPFPYVDGLILEVTNNLTSVEAEHHKRYSGKSNYTFIRSFSVFLKLLTSYSVAPLRLATIAGSIIAIIGFILAIYYILEYIFISHIVEGWTSLILSTLIIGGLMLMFLGLIGEYLGKMFLTLNKKPQSSIEEIINKKKDI